MPRSAREIDLDPRTYVGLSFPLRADNNNNFAMTKSSLQQAQHNLRNLLLTSLRERPMNPTFGSRLKELCFEQIDDELPAKIEGEIQKAVARWLPYIIIHQIDTLTEGGDKSKIVVRIQFTTSLDPEATTTMEVSPTTNRPTQEEIYKYGAHAGHR